MKDFWLSWKNKTPIESKAVVAVQKARELVIKAIPKESLFAIYIKGSFTRREMKKGSEVDMMPIITENKYAGPVLGTNVPDVHPVVIVPLSLSELKRNKLSSKGSFIPNLRAKPDGLLKKINECKLIYGRPLLASKFPVRSTAQTMKEEIEILHKGYIPAYLKGKTSFDSLVKEVFWFVELEQIVRGINVKHSFESISSSVKQKDHIIHDAMRYRKKEFTRVQTKSFIIKLKKYFNGMKQSEQWKKDEQAHFEGWDFSYLKGRMKEDKNPWNYVNLAKQLTRHAKSLLDIDTGGGEILSKIAPLPKKSYAIEGYKPNVKVARKNLTKHGVLVVHADASRKFPFKNETFDLILNRHGAINAKEIFRVLKKGGLFLTQQVNPKKNFAYLLYEFNEKPKWTFNNLPYRKRELEQVGFKILKAKDWECKIIFKDVGAIVYFLKSTPWMVDGFTVDSHRAYLEKLQKKLEAKGSLQFTLARFLIFAKKENKVDK